MILSSFDIITQAVNEDYQQMCSVLVKVIGVFKFKSDDHWLKPLFHINKILDSLQILIIFYFFICLLCYLTTHFKNLFCMKNKFVKIH